MRKGLAMEMCVFKDCLVRKILWRECVQDSLARKGLAVGM